MLNTNYSYPNFPFLFFIFLFFYFHILRKKTILDDTKIYMAQVKNGKDTLKPPTKKKNTPFCLTYTLGVDDLPA